MVGIEAGCSSNSSHSSSVAKRNANQVVCHAWQQPDRPFHGFTTNLELVDLLVKTTSIGTKPEPAREPSTFFIEFLKIQQLLGIVTKQPLGSLVAHHQHVVPSDAGDWVRSLEQPAVVAPATVIHAVITIKGHLVVVLGWYFRRFGPALQLNLQGIPVDFCSDVGSGTVGKVSIVEEFFPIGFTLAGDTFKSLTSDLIGICLLGTSNPSQHLQFGHATEQRSN